IAYQDRPRLFDRHIVLPEMLYEDVIEIDECLSANGSVMQAPDSSHVRAALQAVFDQGVRALAIVFMHAWTNPEHEALVQDIATQIGFTQISASYQVSPLIKFVSRGDTAVVDAYLSPILR